MDTCDCSTVTEFYINVPGLFVEYPDICLLCCFANKMCISQVLHCYFGIVEELFIANIINNTCNYLFNTHTGFVCVFFCVFILVLPNNNTLTRDKIPVKHILQWLV